MTTKVRAKQKSQPPNIVNKLLVPRPAVMRPQKSCSRRPAHLVMFSAFKPNVVACSWAPSPTIHRVARAAMLPCNLSRSNIRQVAQSAVGRELAFRLVPSHEYGSDKTCWAMARRSTLNRASQKKHRKATAGPDSGKCGNNDCIPGSPTTDGRRTSNSWADLRHCRGCNIEDGRVSPRLDLGGSLGGMILGIHGSLEGGARGRTGSMLRFGFSKGLRM